MGRYLFHKLLSLLPVLLGISLAAFLLGVSSPGDPAELALSQGGYEPTAEQVAEMERQLGLDAPYPVQFLRWVGRALTGDLGTSYHSRRPVGEELLRRLPVTIKLTACAMVLACALGIAMGCAAALWRGRWPDRALRVLIDLQLSLPGFWLGLLLILLFAETLGWLPTSGNGGLKHMVLPAVTLSSATAATAARLTRSALLTELEKQYCIAATAWGVPPWRLVFRTALPSAIPPTVALLGNSLGGMLGGSVIVESIFALPGLGSYALEAIGNRDYPALQGYVLLTGAIYVGVTLLVDLLSLFLDPRVRLEGRR